MMFEDYVVAPAEADMQVCRVDGSVPVCRDSDLVGYGHTVVYIIDSYSKETWQRLT